MEYREIYREIVKDGEIEEPFVLWEQIEPKVENVKERVMEILKGVPEEYREEVGKILIRIEKEDPSKYKEALLQIIANNIW